MAVAYRGQLHHLRIHPTDALARRDLTCFVRTCAGNQAIPDAEAAEAWLQRRSHEYDWKIVSAPLDEADESVDEDTTTPVAHIEQFLRQGGFLIQTFNPSSTSAGCAHEAWAYRGPLDLALADPMCFGLGESLCAALRALNEQLAGLIPLARSA